MAWVLAGCLWALAVFNLHRLRGPSIDRSLFWGSAWSATAVTFDIDSLHSWLDLLVGVANLATLIEHIGEVLAITYLGRIFGAITSAGATLGPPTRPAIRLMVPSILVCLLAALFAASDLPREVPHVAVTYGDQASVAVFWLIANGYLAWAAHQMVMIAFRHADSIRRRDLRVGVTLTGCACALLYPFSLAEASDLLNRWLPVGASHALMSVSDVTRVAAVLLFAAGLGTPGLVRATRLGSQHVRDYLNLLALRPMWAEMVAAIPNARFDDSESSLRKRWSDTVPRHIQLKLADRVIEILDAQLVLAGYVDRTKGDQPAEASAMAREAAWTRAALRRRLGGGQPDSREREFVEGRETISDEASYLVGVWQQMTVQAIATRPSARRWQQRISTALEPRLVIALVSLLGGLLARHGWLPGIGWGLVSLVVAPMLPGLAYDLVERRVGDKTARAHVARARVAPLTAAVVLVIAGTAVLWLASAPRLTVATTLSVAAASIVLLTARLWANVSGHVSAAAGAMAFLIFVASPWYAFLLIGVIALAQSRVTIGAHTVPEVAWATIIGFVATAVPLLLSGYGAS